MIFAGAMDLFTMTIPNKISIVLILMFLLLAPFSGFGWFEFAMHISAGVLFLLIGFALFAFGIVGGGDAKLLAVVGLWLGFEHLYEYSVYAVVIGGVITIGILMMRKMVMPVWMVRQNWFSRLYHDQTGVPYGIALAAAALIIYPQTLWITPLL